MKNNLYKFMYQIISMIILLFVAITTLTSCSINSTKVKDNFREKAESSEEKVKELADTAKQLLENSLLLNDVTTGIGFSIDIIDDKVIDNSVPYCRIYSNEYNFKSAEEIEQLFFNTYSDKDTIYKLSHTGDIPLFIDFDGQLYAYESINSTSQLYLIMDWSNIYITDATGSTAVINYPLYYFRDGIDGVKMYKNTISKVDGIWLLDDVLESEVIELDETSKKTLGIRSIALERINSLQLTKFIGTKGESIEQDGVEYTNIGYSPDSAQYESYTNENLLAYCENYTSNIHPILYSYFREIDGKLYAKSIDSIHKEYMRDYKPETLEVLNVSNTEASLRIKYLDSTNQERSLQFKMYPDAVMYWRWLPDTII